MEIFKIIVTQRSDVKVTPSSVKVPFVATTLTTAFTENGIIEGEGT